MKENEYKCAMCGGVFEKGWTDEEAMKESKEIWGEIPEEDLVVICDDCFNRRTPEEIKSMGDECKQGVENGRRIRKDNKFNS